MSHEPPDVMVFWYSMFHRHWLNNAWTCDSIVLIAEPSQNLKPTNQLSTSPKATHPVMIWAPMSHPSRFPRSNWDKKHLFFFCNFRQAVKPQLDKPDVDNSMMVSVWQRMYPDWHDAWCSSAQWVTVWGGFMKGQRNHRWWETCLGAHWLTATATAFPLRAIWWRRMMMPVAQTDWWKQKGKAMNRWIHVIPLTRRVVPFLVWRIAPAKLLRGRRGRTLQKLT